MARPMVSVLMSVYNGERYLRESVESILNQTFADFEFLIIDDGSTDGSKDIIESYSDPRIQLVHNERNIGLTRSLNKGLRLARGEYIARQDSDDVSLPERLTVQTGYLEQHTREGLLGSAYYVVNAQGKREAVHRPPETDTELRWQMLFHNAFSHTSVILRRDLLDKAHLFYDETLPYSQDYEFWNRVLKYTCATNLKIPLVAWRKSDEAISTTCHEEQQRIATAISAKQINRLFRHTSLALADVATLREWYYRLPERLTKQDMVLCRVVLEILNAFEKSHNVDPDIVRSLRRRWIDRVLATIAPQQMGDLWASGLLGSMFCEDTSSTLTHLPRRSMRWVERVFQVRGRV